MIATMQFNMQIKNQLASFGTGQSSLVIARTSDVKI
jgi:hypothetical protein